MNDAEKVLVSILAATDATHWPVRRFLGTVWPQSAYAARLAFVDRGIPFRHNAKNDAERKRITRGLDAAVEAGDVTTVRMAGEKLPFVRLTEAGELKAQHLANGPSIIDGWCWTLFEAIQRHEGASVPEDDLLPCWRAAFGPRGSWTRQGELCHVTQSLLPFIRRGWIEVGSTINGNARYWLGAGACEAKRPSVKVPDVAVGSGQHHYDESFDIAYSTIKTAELDNEQEIGIMPIPA